MCSSPSVLIIITHHLILIKLQTPIAFAHPGTVYLGHWKHDKMYGEFLEVMLDVSGNETASRLVKFEANKIVASFTGTL